MMDTFNSNKVVIYARVSSKEQEREGYSIPAQLKLLKSYAEKNNYEIMREFIDIETAKQSGRTNFNEMIKFLKDDPDVKMVLCEKTDRLYRNFKDYVIMDDLNLTLVFVKEGAVLNKYSHSHEKFIHGIKVLMAKNYIDNLSEETRKGMLEKAEEGEYPAYAPLGYKHNKIDKTIEIDKERAPLIKELFELYAEGNYSVRKLTGLMFQKNLRTRNLKPVSRSMIDELLKNPFYYGDFYWSGKIWHGKHQPIISKELFNKVQSMIHRYKNTRPQDRGFIYSGLLVCGKCGSSIVAEIKKNKYIYYHCSFNKGKCGNSYIREDDLENELGNIFQELEFDEKILEWIKQALKSSLYDKDEFHRKAMKKLNDDYLKLENRINKIYIDKLDGVVKEELYKSMTFQWREEQEKIMKLIKSHQKASINYIDEGIRLLDLAHNSYEYFKNKDKTEKAILIKYILKGSKLIDGKIEPLFKPPFDIVRMMSCEGRKINAEKHIEKPIKKAGKEYFPAMPTLLREDKATRKFEDAFVINTIHQRYGRIKINIQ